MAGRLAIGVAMAACFLTTGGLYAQGPSSYGPATYGPAANGPATYGPAAYGPAAYGPSSYGPASYGPADNGGWTGNYAAGNGDAAPGGYPPQAGPCGYMPQSAFQQPTGPTAPAPQPNPYIDCNGMTATSDTRDSEPVDETPFEEILCRVARNVIFNIDYINWSIIDPHKTLIGAQPTLDTLNQNFEGFTTLLRDPTQFFPVTNGLARAYDTGPISLYENSGIKGTLSLPLTFGSAELTGFGLQPANSQVYLGGLPNGTPPNQIFAAIPFKINEQPSSELDLFTQSFRAEYSSVVFGGEFNIVFNPIEPKQYGLLIRPMLGFRYLGIQEQFDVQAANLGVAATTIDSRTFNNIYGPQLGLRLEFVTQWVTLGADPRVMLGVNQFASSVSSSDANFGSSGDSISSLRFTPVGALDLYAKIPIHDQVKLYFAYNLIGTGNISRPQEQIDYNLNEVNNVLTNDIHLNLSHSEFIVQGLSAGLEFNF
jgi:hypothetical protein